MQRMTVDDEVVGTPDYREQTLQWLVNTNRSERMEFVKKVLHTMKGDEVNKSKGMASRVNRSRNIVMDRMNALKKEQVKKDKKLKKEQEAEKLSHEESVVVDATEKPALAVTSPAADKQSQERVESPSEPVKAGEVYIMVKGPDGIYHPGNDNFHTLVVPQEKPGLAVTSPAADKQSQESVESPLEPVKAGEVYIMVKGPDGIYHPGNDNFHTLVVPQEKSGLAVTSPAADKQSQESVEPPSEPVKAGEVYIMVKGPDGIYHPGNDNFHTLVVPQEKPSICAPQEKRVADVPQGKPSFTTASQASHAVVSSCATIPYVRNAWWNKYKPSDIIAFDTEYVTLKLSGEIMVGTICIVDYDGNVLLNLKCEHKPGSFWVTDYTTVINGFTSTSFLDGIEFDSLVDQVLQMFHGKLIITCGGNQDYKCLGDGVDQNSLDSFDLHEHWFNTRINEHLQKITEPISLRSLVKHYFDVDIQTSTHSAKEDAVYTMKLFREKYLQGVKRCDFYQRKNTEEMIFNIKRIPSGVDEKVAVLRAKKKNRRVSFAV